MKQQDQEIKNIHSTEFKEVLKELLINKDFPRDILFNGGKREYTLLPFEIQQELSTQFKRFVNENVICNMNQEVEFILNCSFEDRYNNIPYGHMDIENLESFDFERAREDILNYYLFENNSTYESLRKILEEYLNNLDDEEIKEFIEEESELDLNKYDYTTQEEVYQWFKVSNWLCERLRDNGDAVIYSHNYYGRTSYGQSLELDCNMQDIFLKWWCE